MVHAGCYLTGEEGEGEFWGKSRGVTGLFTPVSAGLRRVRLSGIAPEGRLQQCIERIGSKRALAGNADLVLLDTAGHEVGSYFVADVTVESAERADGSADTEVLMDLTVTLDCENLLPEAERPWDLVRTGTLDRPGLWHSLDAAARHAWLAVALNHHGYRKSPTGNPGAVYEMDGRFISDGLSFYCALGEAVNGPGGYFGWNLSAIEDCLTGGWGATPPFTLNWLGADESRRRMEGDEKLGDDYQGRFIEYLDEIFDRRGIEINLL
ncbi:barstar family protein [Streptomyces sp. NPDC002276]